MVCMLANKESNYKRDRTILYTGLFCSMLFQYSTLASHLFTLKFNKTKLEIETLSS